MINLWNPTSHMSILMALITAFLLGIVHGVTPDEHTWPITFSYSIGSYSTKGGMKAGFLFSLAFTLQRAIASELAFLILSSILVLTKYEGWIYVVVGALMAVSGAYILRLGDHLHFLGFLEKGMRALLRLPDEHDAVYPRQSPVKLALLHGFVAGWGTGAFATIVYTVLAPMMPSAYVGFLPGLFFGLGTMVMQVVLGAFIGWFFSKLHLPSCALPYVARRVSGMILTYGGLAFVIVGLLEQVLPIDSWSIITGIPIHNLHSLGVGFFLAVIVLFGVAVFAMVSSIRKVKTVDFCEDTATTLLRA
nr:hypothetical protein [Bacilli bacterium]